MQFIKLDKEDLQHPHSLMEKIVNLDWIEELDKNEPPHSAEYLLKLKNSSVIFLSESGYNKIVKAIKPDMTE